MLLARRLDGPRPALQPIEHADRCSALLVEPRQRRVRIAANRRLPPRQEVMDQLVAAIAEFLQLRFVPRDGLGISLDREPKAEPRLLDHVRRPVALVLNQDRACQLAGQVAH